VLLLVLVLAVASMRFSLVYATQAKVKSGKGEHEQEHEHEGKPCPSRATVTVLRYTVSMQIEAPCGRMTIAVQVPDGAAVYESHFPSPSQPAAQAVLTTLRSPLGAPPFREALAGRRPGEVVVVVSDVTRPVPYARFLPELLAEVEAAGVERRDILLLVATGMHRPCTAGEHAEMFGEAAARYRILDHEAGDEANLVELPGRSRSGARVRLNRRYIEAGFRIATGLVEPHFMAGFSGGRKAICPGVADLGTVRHFHGADFMGDPRTRNANLAGNPCHEEALSVARIAPPDFSLSVVMDRERRVVGAFAGDLDAAHTAACRFVARCACPRVEAPADVVLTGSGGYPLDATFYQCVKGLVSCLPAVRRGGAVVAFGGCSEGIGSPEYAGLMRRYSGRWHDFLTEVRRPGAFSKDQWQFQMHCRALEKVGQAGLHFVTDGLHAEDLAAMSVTPHAAEPGRVAEAVQAVLDSLLAGDRTLAVLPDGPYCAPVSPQEAP
jgi:nickel-dependent lactate racemase